VTLRERLAVGPDRRRSQQPVSEFRRRTDRALRDARPQDPRPEWLRRGLAAKDETGAVYL
jgi:hypothetical protein